MWGAIRIIWTNTRGGIIEQAFHAISQRQTTWTIIPDKDTIKSADEPKYDTDKERDGEVGGTKKGERNIKEVSRKRS